MKNQETDSEVKKIILTGLTEKAETSLGEEDFRELFRLIGTEVKETDNSELMMMSDGKTAHKSFLEYN